MNSQYFTHTINPYVITLVLSQEPFEALEFQIWTGFVPYTSGVGELQSVKIYSALAVGTKRYGFTNGGLIVSAQSH